MTNTALAQKLANPAAQKPGLFRAEINDYAIRTLRELNAAGALKKAGHTGPLSRGQLAMLLNEEAHRCRTMGIEANNMAGYLKARRVGSSYRIGRATRAAVFAVITTRNLI